MTLELQSAVNFSNIDATQADIRRGQIYRVAEFFKSKMAPNSGFLRLAGMAYAMMLMIFLSGTVVAAPVSELVSSANVLVGRGIVSPSNAELLHNTIGFGAVGLIAFCMRL
jgi:hypothetical protein